MNDQYDPPFIDDEERELIESLDEIEPQSLGKPDEEKMAKLRKAARSHLKRASAKMNIRIAPEELELIKRRADQEGLKYQSLVKSVMHKYVTGQLVETGKWPIKDIIYSRLTQSSHDRGTESDCNVT
jgi:predicted DNA binding CopG/RHH family protein